jgi:hypothetical protein
LANTFITPLVIARLAARLLKDNVIMPFLVDRTVEDDLAVSRKVGDTVKVRVRPTLSVNEFTEGTPVTVQDITESSISVQLTKLFDVSVQIGDREASLNLVDFQQQVLEPVLVPFAEHVNKFILDVGTLEVNNFLGTAGDPPDSLADVTALNKKANELKMPAGAGSRAHVMNPTAENDILNIANVIEADKRGRDDATAFELARMGRVFNADYFMTQGIKSHTAGTFRTGTPAVDGAVSAGAKTMNMDGGAATGTIKPGDLFTVATVAGQYVFTNSKTATGGAITDAQFTPAAPAGGFPNDSLVTIVADHAKNLFFNRSAIALALIPPTPNSLYNFSQQVVTPDGFGLRVSANGDIALKRGIWSFDLMAGVKLVNPNLAFISLG